MSLGAGGFGLVKAVSPEGASAYVPITPCRLVDTRPGDGNVGAPAAPLGPDGVLTVAGWGDVAGDCNLPGDSTGLQLNVTAVDASQATFLTLYPQGATRPTASNVNVDGPAATPNSATVTLNPANGQFDVFNRFGTVNVIIDVAGYYAAHQHDGADIIDESLTGADVTDESLTGADVTDGSISGADVQNNSLDNTKTSNEPGLAYNVESDPNPLATADEFVVRTRINVPSDGFVVANAELQWRNGTNALDRARCQITKGDDVSIATNEPYLRLTDGGDTSTGLFYSDTHHRVVEVDDADDTGTIITGFGQYINLVCDQTDGVVQIEYATLTLEFFASDYSPTGFIIVLPFEQGIEE